MTASPPKNAAVTAVAGPNIALVKYWGKADVQRNLPAVGSLSITLSALTTTTRVTPAARDDFRLNGEPEPAMARRCFDFIARFWPGPREPLRIDTVNDFPTAAGLASSASGFAALAVALDACFGTALGAERLARIAGAGSGSAARSLFGGFVRLDIPAPDEDDIRVRPIAVADDFPLAVIVAITSEQRKAISSSEAMQRTADSSPYYQRWVEDQAGDLDRAERAVAARDFDALAEVSEQSCLKMHAVMQAASPGILYWNPATIACVHRIRSLRDEGCQVFFTIDAGPQVKAVCTPGCAERVAQALAAVDGVARVLRTGLGAGARLLPADR